MRELVTIATFPDAGAASIVRASLEVEGITAHLQGAEAASTLWHVGTALGGVQLQVASDDVERASALLHDGHAPLDGPSGPWVCGPCGEPIDAGFDVCWMCGANRSESRPDGDGEHRDGDAAELEALAIADGEAEPHVADVAGAATATDWDRMAERAWRATLIGLVCPPVLVYAIFLLTQVLGRELRPPGQRRVIGATLIVVLYLVPVLWLFGFDRR
jgi:hypothetical protein